MLRGRGVSARRQRGGKERIATEFRGRPVCGVQRWAVGPTLSNSSYCQGVICATSDPAIQDGARHWCGHTCERPSPSGRPKNSTDAMQVWYPAVINTFWRLLIGPAGARSCGGGPGAPVLTLDRSAVTCTGLTQTPFVSLAKRVVAETRRCELHTVNSTIAWATRGLSDG